jgi:hypothetical protein
MKYKLLLSLLIGTGLVGLVFVTMDVTWIGGIALLMPGIALLGILPYRPVLDSTPIAMLVASALIYSLVAFAIILIVGRSVDPSAFRKTAKITAGVVLAAVLIGWASTQALDRYGFGTCENEAAQYLSSPGGQYRAVIFYRNCGATTNFVTNVSLLKELEIVNHSETGNLLVASGKLPIQLNWTSATHLIVTYPTGSEPRLIKPAYEGVTVDYVASAAGNTEQ